MLKKILEDRKMSLYQCAKLSHLPYTTLYEVVNGKTALAKCSAETVLKLSQVFGMTMESLLSDADSLRPDTEVYKSNVCHAVRDQGDLNFLIGTLQSDEVRRLWEKKWYFEAFYLLGMLDLISRENGLPLCDRYDDIRERSLKNPLYPRDVLMAEKLHPQSQNLRRCREAAIPEFLRFNIIETDPRNVY